MLNHRVADIIITKLRLASVNYPYMHIGKYTNCLMMYNIMKCRYMIYDVSQSYIYIYLISILCIYIL